MTDWLLYACLVALPALLALVVFLLWGQPTCEELGYRTVLSHFQPVFTGKTFVLIPIYRCDQ